MKRSQKVWVIEFDHSTGWAAIEGTPFRDHAWDIARKWRQSSPRNRFRVVAYVPEQKKRKAAK